MEATKVKEKLQVKDNRLCLCLILNFINFSNEEHSNADSIESINNLSKTLEKLNMKVVMKFDLEDIGKVKKEIHQVIKGEKWNDSFLLYINSPGKNDGFLTKNNHVVTYHEIYSFISNHSNLANKLKIIMFDCVGSGKN